MSGTGLRLRAQLQLDTLQLQAWTLKGHHQPIGVGVRGLEARDGAGQVNPTALHQEACLGELQDASRAGEPDGHTVGTILQVGDTGDGDVLAVFAGLELGVHHTSLKGGGVPVREDRVLGSLGRGGSCLGSGDGGSHMCNPVVFRGYGTTAKKPCESRARLFRRGDTRQERPHAPPEGRGTCGCRSSCWLHRGCAPRRR